MSATAASRSLVVDANASVWAVLPAQAATGVAARFVVWAQDNRQLVAPMLWLAEATSAIRRYASARAISLDRAQEALEDLFSLGIVAVPMTHAHCRAALEWARRLQQVRAYDGFYLALAEERQVPFWTADRRLVNAAQQAGVNWVHWMGEPVGEQHGR